VLPVSAYLYAMREEITTVLFLRGAMSSPATHAIAAIFGIVLLQQPAGSVHGLLIRTSVARGHVLAVCASSAVTLLSALCLIPTAAARWQSTGVASASVVVCFLSLGALFALENRDGNFAPWRTLAWHATRYLAVSGAIVGELACLRKLHVLGPSGGAVVWPSVNLTLAAALGLATVAVSAPWLKLYEVNHIAALLKRKLGCGALWKNDLRCMPPSI
jgi:peptidoglycan biosynthesis protein MviN/MurJ (putative lipid II flippase)